MNILALVGPDYSGDIDENDPKVREFAEAEGVKIVLWKEIAGDTFAQSDISGLLICGHAVVNVQLLDSFPNLKIVSNYGVGVDHIDLGACRDRNIPVGNTPNVLSDATCDMGWTLLMATARRVVEADSYARSAAFTEYENMTFLGKVIALCAVFLLACAV